MSHQRRRAPRERSMNSRVHFASSQRRRSPASGPPKISRQSQASRASTASIPPVLVRLADEGARVALVLLALQRTGSAAVGGALVAALLVPHVVAAPAVALLTDRARSPRRVIAAAALGFASALACAALALGAIPTAAVVAV